MVRKLILGLLALAVSAGAADIPAGKVLAGNQQLVRQVTSLPPVDERLKQSHPEDAPWLQDLFEGLTVVDHQGNIQPGSQSAGAVMITGTGFLRCGKMPDGQTEAGSQPVILSIAGSNLPRRAHLNVTRIICCKAGCTMPLKCLAVSCQGRF